MEHTPTPWYCTERRPGDNYISIMSRLKDTPVEARLVQNAEFIVRAVNSHEGLLEALNSVYFEVIDFEERCDKNVLPRAIRDQLIAAIAKAEGK